MAWAGGAFLEIEVLRIESFLPTVITPMGGLALPLWAEGGFSVLRLVHLGTTCMRQAGVHDEFEAPLLHEPIFRALPHPRHDGLNPAFGFVELSTSLAKSSIAENRNGLAFRSNCLAFIEELQGVTLSIAQQSVGVLVFGGTTTRVSGQTKPANGEFCDKCFFYELLVSVPQDGGGRVGRARSGTALRRRHPSSATCSSYCSFPKPGTWY